MTSAAYSLLTIQPDLERVDRLCVGVVVCAEGEWQMRMLPDTAKLSVIAPTFPQERLVALESGLKRLFAGCRSIPEARRRLVEHRSSVAIHEFDGQFGFNSADDFGAQVNAIMRESVLPPPRIGRQASLLRRGRQRLPTKLRDTFAEMGILGARNDDLDSHRVLRDFPVSVKPGLVADFALKNSVVHVTGAVDFGIGASSKREKNFEAQAKCLVMSEATKSFGDGTKGYFVISGSSSAIAAESVDLLSTMGTIHHIDSADDMSAFYSCMEHAARAPS